MNSRYRSLHLALASSVAVAFIVSSYVLSGPFSLRPSTVDAATAESLLKSYASKDSDSDGLPDWQETLYGTDPANPESVKIGVRDGDAVTQGLVKPKFSGQAAPNTDPKNNVETDVADNTVTAQFARSFFTEYFNTYGGVSNLTEEQLTSFTRRAVDKLVAQRGDNTLYKMSAVKVEGTGAEALRAYAARVETMLSKSPRPSEDAELQLLSDALEKNDLSALPKIQETGHAYSVIGKSLMTVSVPKEAAQAHLATANAFGARGLIIIDMGSATTDPLRSLVGLALYRDSGVEFARSLAEIYKVFEANGAVIKEGEPGYGVYTVIKFAYEKTR